MQKVVGNDPVMERLVLEETKDFIVRS